MVPRLINQHRRLTACNQKPSEKQIFSLKGTEDILDFIVPCIQVLCTTNSDIKWWNAVLKVSL